MNGSDLKAIRETAEKFARKELEKSALEFDDYPFADFNQAAVEAARQAGFFSLLLPEELGGPGMGMSALCEVLRVLARSDAGFAAVLFVHCLGQAALMELGSEESAKAFLASPLIAFPAFDSPVDLPREVKAEPVEDGYALSGRLEFMPLAGVAEVLIIPAEAADTGKVGFFALARNSAGLSLSEPLLTLGLRACPVADLELSQVKASSSNLVCADAEDRYPALASRFRAAAAALAAGIVEGSYQAAKDYCKERYQGGRNIIDYDMVRLMLSNLLVVAESGKTMVRAMAEAADRGAGWPLAESGFILLSEQAARATTDGVQCLGGYGYMKDYGQEKRMRDAKQVQLIFGGAAGKRLELMEEVLRQEE